MRCVSGRKFTPRGTGGNDRDQRLAASLAPARTTTATLHNKAFRTI